MKKKMSDEQIDKAVEIYCNNNGFDEGEPTEDIILTADDIKCGITVEDKKREKAFLDALNNDLDNAALNQNHTKPQPKKCGTKRINISINENDYEELKNYCYAKGYSISGFVVQTSMQAVKADIMLNLMRTLISSLTLSDALTDADRMKILSTISAMETLNYGGDNNG